MIIDAYSPTQTPSSAIIRIISNSNEPLEITCRQRDVNSKRITLLPKNPSITDGGLHYWSIDLPNLTPDTSYAATVTQTGCVCECDRIIMFRTLPQPQGQRLVRFGILADLHISESARRSPHKSTGKRLYGHASELCAKYLKRVEEMGAEFIVLPGDVSNSESDEDMELAKRLVEEFREKSSIEVFPIIGNHEAVVDKFNKYFNLDTGYYSFSRHGVHFVFLCTPDQHALEEGSEQLRWLEEDLQAHQHEDTLLFSHYSLRLMPFMHESSGYLTQWDDGAQVLHNGPGLCKMLTTRYPRVRAVICGHKNIPSCHVDQGLLHVLCPQVIQAPCAFDIVEIWGPKPGEKEACPLRRLSGQTMGGASEGEENTRIPRRKCSRGRRRRRSTRGGEPDECDCGGCECESEGECCKSPSPRKVPQPAPGKGQHAMVRTIWEIDEQHWLQLSRSRCVGAEWRERFGKSEQRNFVHYF